MPIQIVKIKMSQSQIIKTVAEASGNSTAAVKQMLGSLGELAEASLKKGSVGKIVIPSLNVMIKMKARPARKAGKGMSFGKEVMLPARKAQSIVKAFPNKKLKDAVNY